LLQMLKDHSIQSSLRDKLKSAIDDIDSIEIVEMGASDRLSDAGKRKLALINSKEFKAQTCPKCGAFSEHWRKHD